MNTIKIEIEVPESLASYIDIKDQQYQKKVRELMLYQLIKEDKISFGKAAEMLEVDRITLITELGKLGLPYFDCDLDDVISDAENLKKLAEEKQ